MSNIWQNLGKKSLDKSDLEKKAKNYTNLSRRPQEGGTTAVVKIKMYNFLI